MAYKFVRWKMALTLWLANGQPQLQRGRSAADQLRLPEEVDIGAVRSGRIAEEHVPGETGFPPELTEAVSVSTVPAATLDEGEMLRLWWLAKAWQQSSGPG